MIFFTLSLSVKQGNNTHSCMSHKDRDLYLGRLLCRLCDVTQNVIFICVTLSSSDQFNIAIEPLI